MRRVIFLLAAMVATGCEGSERPRPGPASGLAEGGTPRILAEAVAVSAPLRIQIVSARRVAQDSVRVDLVLASEAGAGVEAQSAQAAVQSAVAALAGASLVSADGHRRVFPLQDASGRPVGSALEPPEPGERRAAWLVFAGHPRDAGPMTLVLPGFPPFRNVPVS